MKHMKNKQDDTTLSLKEKLIHKMANTFEKMAEPHNGCFIAPWHEPELPQEILNDMLISNK